MTHLSRREFTTLAAAAAAAPFALGPDGLGRRADRQGLIDRITAQIGVPWKPDTVDGLKAGDPATVVTGVVTTAMATHGGAAAGGEGRRQRRHHRPADVLREGGRADAARAAAAAVGGSSAAPPDAPPPPDPVFTAKNEFIDSTSSWSSG